MAGKTRRERKVRELQLDTPRAIKFSREEWEAARKCGMNDFGGLQPAQVTRKFLRDSLIKRGYL